MTKRTRTTQLVGLASVCLLAALALSVRQARAPAQPNVALARTILSATGVKGGLVVHVGCGEGKLTAALRANDRYLVHGLDRNWQNVRQARAYIRSRGVYGPVSVDYWSGGRLPYADNLVNLLVLEDAQAVPPEEVLRVLTPNGVAYFREGSGWRKQVKPWPRDLDEWTHHLHGADGNPVANDLVVGPPQGYQWLAGPLWSRSHDTDSSVSAVVTAQGRLFYIVDEAPISLPGDHALPDKWSLVARDAFNGVLLWKVPIEHWGWREWKNTWFTDRPDNLPVNLPRRLVAVGDRVYVTLGYHAPVSELDAATGKVLRTYEGTEDTREILWCRHVLILSVLRGDRLKVMAVDAEQGKVLWETPPTFVGSAREYFPLWRRSPKVKVDPALNPATEGEVVVLIDGRDLVGLDFASGKERWRTRVEAKEVATSVGTLIVCDGVVLHADRDELIALSAQTGERMWSQPKRDIGWLWFQWKDVFVIDGLVWTWNAQLESAIVERGGRKYRQRWPISLNAYDLHTGELKRRVPLDNIFKTYHHHRCYRNKATPRYLIASRRGAEFVSLEGQKHVIDNWVRATCHLGMMPANGLLYAPPHPCVCYINEKLSGFNALAPTTSPEVAAEQSTSLENRLEKGPAYGAAMLGQPSPAAEEDWPTWRHDGLRSGATTAAVPSKLKLRWNVRVGSRVSPPSVAAGKVFVSAIDEHHLIALNVAEGKKVWEFAAGARVDTPPTYYRGLVLFGSADGWVYCLRAEDGALVWRFQAAPAQRLIGAFGQLESAWPVQGSVLVQKGVVYVAAGRSSHLDGGIWLYALDPLTGKVLHQAHLEGPRLDSENIPDNVNPEQGARTDLLQGDGQFVYLRHLTFDAKLQLQEKAGRAERLQATYSFLDDTYFKRAPWNLGRGMWGNVMVHDERTVYFVRMFDTLRCLDPANYFTPGKKGYLLGAQPKIRSTQVKVANSPSLDPKGTPLSVEAWVKAEGPDGVVLARGGLNHGYALVLKKGQPRFVLRIKDKVCGITADREVVGQWVHLAGVLTDDQQMQIYVDGQLAASAPALGFLAATPGQAMEIGADAGTGVGEYESPFGFTGLIDEVRIYHRALRPEEIRQHFAQPGGVPSEKEEKLVLYFSFDDGRARDLSGKGNQGKIEGAKPVPGRSGQALRFTAGGGNTWAVRVPIRVRALVVAGEQVFAAGPPDVLEAKDPLGAFEGRKGGLLWTFAAESGEKIGEYRLDSPPVFNGLAAARGRLYLSTVDGQVLCFGGAGVS
ncbi:MAG TPA: hypothetical protein EYP85_16715 [Armatimonadetes bacterium]|nr:hypothetical protein [Armatimonadota bacterium]